jgi:hypothetical protein
MPPIGQRRAYLACLRVRSNFKRPQTPVPRFAAATRNLAGDPNRDPRPASEPAGTAGEDGLKERDAAAPRPVLCVYGKCAATNLTARTFGLLSALPTAVLKSALWVDGHPPNAEPKCDECFCTVSEARKRAAGRASDLTGLRPPPGRRAIGSGQIWHAHVGHEAGWPAVNLPG